MNDGSDKVASRLHSRLFMQYGILWIQRERKSVKVFNHDGGGVWINMYYYYATYGGGGKWQVANGNP